jgi:anti-sigma factor RsiW
MIFRRRRRRPAPLSCQELVELVTDYIEGALDDVTRARFDAHLTDCDGCTAYVEQMRETIRLVGRLDETNIPPEARAKMMDAFRDWKAEQG